MRDINQAIKQARPNLKLVSPLAAAIMLGYGFVNIALGFALMIYINPAPNAEFAIVNNTVTFSVWGLVFIALGAFKLYTYHNNDWALMRLSLLIGVAIKAIWFIALFFRWLDGGSVLIMIIWFFFMYVQIVTFVHFIPNVKQRLS